MNKRNLDLSLTLWTGNLSCSAGRSGNLQRTALLVKGLLGAAAGTVLGDAGGLQLAAVSLVKTLALLHARGAAELGVDGAAVLVVGLGRALSPGLLALVVAAAALGVSHAW